MIFTVKDKRTGKYKYDTAPECPIHGGPCKLGGCAAFEWFSNYDVEPLEKGYCGLTRGASFASGFSRYVGKNKY